MEISMRLQIDDEFRAICSRIVADDKTNDEWAKIESSDMFQTENYCGGYDADERAFCFSHYDAYGKERWFQISLQQVAEILQGTLGTVDIREPD